MRRLAVFLLAAGLPGGIDAETLLVANKREATLTFVDPDSGIVRAAIPTGLDPHQVEVSGDGRRAVVSMYGTDGKPARRLPSSTSMSPRGRSCGRSSSRDSPVLHGVDGLAYSEL